MRGLKYKEGRAAVTVRGSHPARGAWIEMLMTCVAVATLPSHPARGAWIEIEEVPAGSTIEFGRTPQGVRGLKLAQRAGW
mgnify:CR=1 FL=1